MTFRERARKLFINHPACDYVLAALAAGAYLVVDELWGDVFPAVTLDRRAVLLQTLSGIAVAVLGVAVTAIAIVSSLAPRPRVARLVQTVSAPLNRIVLGSLGAVALCAFAFAGLIVVDDRRAVWPWALCTALIALLLCRAARLLWILANLFIGAARDAGPERESPAPPAVPASLDPEQFTLESAQRKR